MNEAECARLFQRFSQTSFGAGLGGSGLGLSIVHQLAQLMDGEVGLRSTPAVGSVFSVYLPMPEVAMADRVPAATTVVAPDRVDAAIAQRCILLIEDDAPDLHRLPWELLLHTLFEESDLVFVDPPSTVDLIVSDLDLPGMGGLQLLPLLRKRIGRQVPALAISARSESTTEAEARAAGFDQFLRKPLDAAELRLVLDRLLSAQRNPAA